KRRLSMLTEKIKEKIHVCRVCCQILGVILYVFVAMKKLILISFICFDSISIILLIDYLLLQPLPIGPTEHAKLFTRLFKKYK
uniref:hypothetical protein n=1 Tax=Vibrio vulnificus TaxID=672 RepID=UPI0019D49372